MKATLKVSLVLAVVLVDASVMHARDAVGETPVVTAKAAGNSGKLTIDIAKVDALFEQALVEIHHQKGVVLMKESLDLCLELNEREPENYEVLWRCARAAGEYGEAAEGIELEGWENISREWGRKGMALAQAAQAIEPERVEAYLWELRCVGAYAAATGVWTAIKEGFVVISRKAVHKAMKLDPTYRDYGPLFACAMFHIRCPRFFGGDREKAYRCFDEFEEKTNWTYQPHVRRPLSAELLIKRYGTKNNRKARQLLELVLSEPHQVEKYRKMAEAMLSSLD